jgi:hypothetical protein
MRQDAIPDDRRLTHNGRLPEECSRCEKAPPTHFIVLANPMCSIAHFFCYACYKVVTLEISTANSPLAERKS